MRSARASSTAELQCSTTTCSGAVAAAASAVVLVEEASPPSWAYPRAPAEAVAVDPPPVRDLPPVHRAEVVVATDLSIIRKAEVAVAADLLTTRQVAATAAVVGAVEGIVATASVTSSSLTTSKHLGSGDARPQSHRASTSSLPSLLCLARDQDASATDAHGPKRALRRYGLIDGEALIAITRSEISADIFILVFCTDLRLARPILRRIAKSCTG